MIYFILTFLILMLLVSTFLFVCYIKSLWDLYTYEKLYQQHLNAYIKTFKRKNEKQNN